MNMPGATFEAFDVVVVPFPFTGKTATSRRPAMVKAAQRRARVSPESCLVPHRADDPAKPRAVRPRSFKMPGARGLDLDFPAPTSCQPNAIRRDRQGRLIQGEPFNKGDDRC
jgi:hypothetical protein